MINPLFAQWLVQLTTVKYQWVRAAVFLKVLFLQLIIECSWLHVRFFLRAANENETLCRENRLTWVVYCGYGRAP